MEPWRLIKSPMESGIEILVNMDHGFIPPGEFPQIARDHRPERVALADQRESLSLSDSLHF